MEAVCQGDAGEDCSAFFPFQSFATLAPPVRSDLMQPPMYAPSIQIRALCRHGNASDQVSDGSEFSGSANVWRQIFLIGPAITGGYGQGIANFCSDRRSDPSACDAILQLTSWPAAVLDNGAV